MATIAKGMITLSVLNDAFSVSLSPNSCVIHANFDGTADSSQLSSAFTNINVCRGDVPAKFSLTLDSSSDPGIKFDVITSEDGFTQTVQITELPVGFLSGELVFAVDVMEDYHTLVTFQFTAVRESTMLDWIQDWNGRRTQIGPVSVITPKAFFGLKDDVKNVLNGVFIGPDGSGTSGIYAYKDCPLSAFGNSASYEIFRLNENGGMIGGWEIDTHGIYKITNDPDSGAVRDLEILSEGILSYKIRDHQIWMLDKDGSGLLASGNIRWDTEGNAEFKGKLTTSSGLIGGWTIEEGHIRNEHILIDADKSYIGVHANNAAIKWDDTLAMNEQHLSQCKEHGGVILHYTSVKDFGLTGYLSQINSIDKNSDGVKTFQLGSTNQIASWKFDDNSLWLGNKLNTTRQYTDAAGSVTIGSNGLRGNSWYIDSDGEASFVSDRVHFGVNGGSLSGWSIQETSLVTAHAALVSETGEAGVYISTGDFTQSSTAAFASVVSLNGGVYMRTDGTTAQIYGYSKQDGVAKQVFMLNSDGDCQIGNWYFTPESLYIGTEEDTAGVFTANIGSITIGSHGIRGNKWRLEATGAGAIAGGNIAWDLNGNVRLSESVKISWGSVIGTEAVTNKLTQIDANGIYTGSINADNIIAGTLSADRINVDDLLSNGGKWALHKDGSGYLASKNISWNTSGTLTVKGHIEADTGYIGGFKIEGEKLTNVGKSYDASIIFQNKEGSIFAGIGNNVAPLESWMTMPAIFKSVMPKTENWSRNIALYLHAENSVYNFAFMGKGNGLLDGWIDGYRLGKIVLTSGTPACTELDISESNRWICDSEVDGGCVVLPSLSALSDAIGCNFTGGASFCVLLTVIGGIKTKEFAVYGRADKAVNLEGNSSPVSLNTTNYPLIVGNEGRTTGRADIKAGSVITFLLVYDPTDQTTAKDPNSLGGQFDSYPHRYTARIINTFATP